MMKFKMKKSMRFLSHYRIQLQQISWIKSQSGLKIWMANTSIVIFKKKGSKSLNLKFWSELNIQWPKESCLSTSKSYKSKIWREERSSMNKYRSLTSYLQRHSHLSLKLVTKRHENRSEKIFWTSKNRWLLSRIS